MTAFKSYVLPLLYVPYHVAPSYAWCVCSFLCREFLCGLRQTSGSSVEQEMPCGQLPERCDHSFFCRAAECMLLNVKYFHKQLEKRSHARSCLLLPQFLILYRKQNSVWPCGSEYSQLLIQNRFILSLNNKNVDFIFLSFSFSSDLFRSHLKKIFQIRFHIREGSPPIVNVSIL